MRERQDGGHPTVRRVKLSHEAASLLRQITTARYGSAYREDVERVVEELIVAAASDAAAQAQGEKGSSECS